MTLSFWRSLPPAAAKVITNYAEAEVYQEIMKNTGVNLEFLHPTAGQEKAQFNLLVASGDLPDIVMQQNFYTGGPAASVADGVCIDLTPYVQQYAPDFYKAITGDEAVYREATDADGKISAMGLIKDRMPPFNRLTVRKDVMQELGIEKIPETIAEYEAAFEKMKAAGMYGFSPVKNAYVLMFSRAFDAKGGWHLDAGGKPVYGQIQEGFKEYLELMNRWYDSGYLSPDFMSVNDEDKAAEFASKKTGFLIQASGIALTRARAGKYEIETLPYPRREPGQDLHMEEVSVNKIEEHWTSVTTACKHPEIAVQFLNYTYTPEGASLANWGIEGLSWEMKDGKKTFTDHVLHNPEYDGVTAQQICKLHQIAKLAEPDILCGVNVVSDPEALEMRVKYADDPHSDDSMILPPIQLTQEQNSERAKIMNEVNTYVDEMVLKFITGTAPLSDWDSYVQQVQSMNLDRALEITQAAYDAYLQKALPPQ